MQLKYKFYYGGNHNPFKREAEEAYRKLSEERKIADRGKWQRLLRITGLVRIQSLELDVPDGDFLLIHHGVSSPHSLMRLG